MTRKKAKELGRKIKKIPASELKLIKANSDYVCPEIAFNSPPQTLIPHF